MTLLVSISIKFSTYGIRANKLFTLGVTGLIVFALAK
jgi:hypothetical protein